MFPLSHKTQIPLQDLNEEVVIDLLPMHGNIPPWLKGTLIRNGPAKFHSGKAKISHWFDGLAMLHAFTIDGVKVSYRNKFLRSHAYMQMVEKENSQFMGFAEDPCVSIFKRLFTYFFPSMTQKIIQNANVNVIQIAENYLALTETPLPVCFDPTTLETLGVLDFQDLLCKKNCFESAHPHYDKKRSLTINYQAEMGSKCQYTIYAISDRKPKIRKPIFTMTSDKVSYMHTFALTERFVVMAEFPLVLNPLDILLKGGGYITHFQWEEERNTRFHVIDRREGKRVKSYETEAFFCFHHVNAYEEKETIVVDLIRYEDASIVFGDPFADEQRKLVRFRLDLKSSSLTQNTLAETFLELPRIHNEKVHMAPYQYVYGVGFKYPSSNQESIPLIKIDVSSGRKLQWNEPGCLAGEPIFVPLPNAQEEDEGILLSVVTDEIKNGSFLLILNAKDFLELARSESLHRIPYGLHGMFSKT